MKRKTRILPWLLILFSNDVQPNPGPNMETISIQSLQREIKEMSKMLQAQKEQILDLTKFQQKVLLEDEVLRLSRELENLKEKSAVQCSLMTRTKTDLSTLDYEVDATKRLSQQNRNELKNFGTLTATDMRNIKEELMKNSESLKEEQEDNKEFKKQFLKLSRVFRVMTDEQKVMVEGLRKDFTSLKEFNRTQLIGLKGVMEKVSSEIKEMQKEASCFRTEIQGLSGYVRNLSSESDQHRALINQTKKIVDSLVSVSKRDSINNEGADNVSTKFEDLAQKLDEHSNTLCLHSREISKVNEYISSSVKNLFAENQESLSEIRSTVEQNASNAEESMSDLRSWIEKSNEIIYRNIEKVSEETSANIDDLSGRTSKIVCNLTERMDEIDGMHDDMQDRVFEIDKNRKNNLVFYGIKGEEMDSDDCERIIKNLMNVYLRVTREIPLTKVTRLWNGPSFRGVKPLLVSFQLFKDKEEILRKGESLLKGTNIYVTEDFSRKIRKRREELLKFARETRSKDPAAKVNLIYDRLYVESDVYLYNEVQSKVEKVLMKILPGENKRRSLLSTFPIDESECDNEENEICEEIQDIKQKRFEKARLSTYPFSEIEHQSTDRIEIEILQYPSSNKPKNTVLPSIDPRIHRNNSISLQKMNALVDESEKSYFPIVNS